MGRRSKQHAPINTLTEGQQDGEENSPGPGSAPSSPSPFTVEEGVNGTYTMDKRKGSLPGTSTPPRPPKPNKTSSYTDLSTQSLPIPSPMVNSGLPAPVVPPKPKGYGKPPPPLPNNDAPPLPPRVRDETPPPASSSPANVIPLPPRENPPPPPLPKRQREPSSSYTS